MYVCIFINAEYIKFINLQSVTVVYSQLFTIQFEYIFIYYYIARRYCIHIQNESYEYNLQQECNNLLSPCEQRALCVSRVNMHYVSFFFICIYVLLCNGRK